LTSHIDQFILASMRTLKRRNVPVSEFKAKILRLVEEAQATGQEYIVTKRGKPMVLVTPITSESRSAFGSWQGAEVGDIVHSDFSQEFSASRAKRR
jgi:prevent-host-death family protein